MIVVTGASGHLGQGVIEALLARTSAERIVASARRPDKVAALAARGVAVRQGEFADPDGLAETFAGATQVLVISVDQFGDEGRRLHRNAIGAARAAGARVLYTSHMGTRPGSAFADHAAAEAVMAEGGGAWTSLRHGFYAESALHLIGDGFATGVIRAPADGPVSWTARADLAEADAAVLANEGQFEGISPPLIAPAAFDMGDIAAIASELTGREIRREVVADDEWLDGATARGMPDPIARALLGMYQSARRGELAGTDSTLERLIGRPPLTMREVLAATLPG